MKILIGENNRELLHTLQRGLGHYQMTSDIVFDGVQTLEKYSNNKYNLLLLDDSLARISGNDVSKEIRGNNKTIPLIIMSNQSEISESILLSNSHVDDFITKPFKLIQLVETINLITALKEKGKDIHLGDFLIKQKYLELEKDCSAKIILHEYSIISSLEEKSYITHEELLKRCPKIQKGRLELFIKTINIKLHNIGSSYEITFEKGKGFKLAKIHD